MGRNIFFFGTIVPVFLIFCLLITTLTGCGIGSQHLEMSYQDNDNESIVGWDVVDEDSIVNWENADIISWSDVDDYSDWVYSQILFEGLTDEYPIIECETLDYKSNGVYFDGDKVYSMVGDKFDVNSFASKYAVGTGVIVICVVLTVATAGSNIPFVCFIAGAAEGSIAFAVKGAAFGAATKAVAAAIESEGDLEDTIYGALEGSADGYMWGAMYGAITGGLNSVYCFVENTPVLTEYGPLAISSINVGDIVLAYDTKTSSYAYKPVTQITTKSTNNTVSVVVNGESIESTYTHPYFTDEGWKQACDLKIGDRVKTVGGGHETITDINLSSYQEPVTTYTLCVDDYHSFLVGKNGIVVHNRCNINSKYAGKTYKPTDPEIAAKYPKGVKITPAGYPDFSPYAIESVSLELPSAAAKKAGTCLTGNYTHDSNMANKLAGYSDTPLGCTWHHNQDMRTLELIPTDLHMAVRHTGGASLIKELLSSLIP